ncbi:MAG TPA: APC family permease [Mycobacterium sp.]|nr:APC family permease [Mycobacterium sp.]
MAASSAAAHPVGLWGAVAIGVGGMVGGGIFAVLGLSVQITKGAAPLAFLLAGLVALLTARSYALLSKVYPSRGGTVTFLNRTFGAGLFSGGINVLLWLSYIVMLALYSQAFGSYAASFLPASAHSLGKHVFLTAAIVVITVVNVAGASTVARAERVVVAIKIAILVLFVAVGVAGVSSERLAPAQWSAPVSVIAGGMIIFLAYEGFELIANAAEDVADPARVLTRAYYISVLFVIALYVAVAVVSVGSLPLSTLTNARDYALAEAARPALGAAGFAMIGIAAMLSTASAINATLYGSARMTYTIAKSRELPAPTRPTDLAPAPRRAADHRRSHRHPRQRARPSQHLHNGQRRVPYHLRRSQPRRGPHGSAAGIGAMDLGGGRRLVRRGIGGAGRQEQPRIR